MAQGQFVVSSVNPNDTMGGGGCICDPMKRGDCKPPYAVFYANETDDVKSPHVVLCETCARLFIRKIDEGEIGVVGERNDHIAVAAEPTFREQEESPIVEWPTSRDDTSAI